ncbi:site-specific integrase [Draconibacterium sp.]|uniref:site-specific integrase n=1 Tax=Draconibacterium sp. TaxID=1965318 RepID=UPI0035695514
MAKIGFHVNFSKTDKNNFAPVRAKISADPKPVIKTFPFKVKVTKNNLGKFECKKWNAETQRLYNFRESDKYYSEYIEINSFLDDYEYQAKQLFKDCLKNKKKLTTELVRKFFAGEEINLEEKKKTFWDAYDDFIKYSKNTHKSNTSRMHNSNKNKLLKFEADTNYKVSFDTVNIDFFDHLQEYILLDKEHGWNYFSKIIDRIKTFMTWSYERNYHQSREFKKFSAPEKKITVIRLTDDELIQLMYYDFKNKSYAKARDFFCFGCLTGARYSDLNRLTKDNIHGEKLIYTPQKTKNPTPVVLPLNSLHFDIINRYKESFKLLPQYENQSFNRMLKKACEEAKLDAKLEVLTHKEKGPNTLTKPKHELITSHTGRKTFICMQHEIGTDIPTIMSYTGLEKMETIRAYLEVSETIKEKGIDQMKQRLMKAKKKADKKKKKEKNKSAQAS